MYPILQTISQYTEIGANFHRHRFRCVINITIYRHRRFTILGRITRYRGRRRRCRTGTGSRPPPAAAMAAAGPLPRHSNRPSLLILGTHGLSEDQGGYLPSIHRAAAAQATAENSVKLEKFETFNDINLPRRKARIPCPPGREAWVRSPPTPTHKNVPSFRRWRFEMKISPFLPLS